MKKNSDIRTRLLFRDRQSTDRQVADLRAFAQREGIEVVGEFEEKLRKSDKVRKKHTGALNLIRQLTGLDC